jgi:hypothetical protein
MWSTANARALQTEGSTPRSVPTVVACAALGAEGEEAAGHAGAELRDGCPISGGALTCRRPGAIGTSRSNNVLQFSSQRCAGPNKLQERLSTNVTSGLWLNLSMPACCWVMTAWCPAQSRATWVSRPQGPLSRADAVSRCSGPCRSACLPVSYGRPDTPACN